MSSNAARIPGDQASVTVSVALDAKETFRVFTGEIDLWWRRGPRFRMIGGDRGIICIEPGAGTRVTVVHRGWTEFRPDHPARHGLSDSAFTRMIGLWWGDQMTALREHGTSPPRIA